jgi:cytochrome oxidase Cu insertion factor (SCO1/SenC/PrrC family)
MSKLSQAELLNEGLWSTIGKGGRLGGGLLKGAASLAVRTVDAALPELTQPWKQAYHGVKGVVAPAYDDMAKVWQGRVNYIVNKLKDMGYIVKDKTKVVKSGMNYIVPAFKIKDYDSNNNPILDNNPSAFLIDRQGVIIRNLRNARPSASIRSRGTQGGP